MTPIEILKGKVKIRLSEKRFLHTVSVAKCALKLADFCEKESKSEAEAASLLHDITKEYALEKQLEILSSHKISVDNEDIASVGILHSFTAPVVIMSDFPDFATERILSAVRNHTIGSPDMTVFDEIIFLADFIEDTRTYDASVSIRRFVFENMKHEDTVGNVKILHKACIMAIDATLINLINNNKPINSKNILTRNALLSKI